MKLTISDSDDDDDEFNIRHSVGLAADMRP